MRLLVQLAADMPDDRMMAALTRDAVQMFATGALIFLVPVLIVAVVVGLVQTILSISEQSLSFLPKLMTLVAMLLLAGERVMHGLANLLESGLIDMVGAIR
ncbi:flagellar biosynthetic protein FliQ [Polymorphobacter multimanifer]|uniref:Flagellar biosynthetic protein FliQ n=2 Tax=Polymorphobacter multimanifer TaxID=1070431 RepID=A0A841L197_9SPHN|nr:flagellar biosynthetic protein FliQ [Polymorphobacter multimanifer]MBB6226334.1 flagellar biosynthetic protein FliQ [Polymorphobacter multimanifer]